MAEITGPRRIACLLLLDRLSLSAVTALAEACQQFTPQIAVRPNSIQAVFLDISGSQKLFSEAGLTLRLEALAKRFGVRSRIAIAEDASKALAMTRYPAYHRSKHLLDLPVDALVEYANPFGLDLPDLKDSNPKKFVKAIETLRLLGIQSAAEFIALPITHLASRFGKEAVELHAQVSGSSSIEGAWPEFKPPEKIFEKIDLETFAGQNYCADLEALLFVLKGLVDRAMARLRGRGRRASVIQVRFELESWAVVKERQWQLDLPVAQGSVIGLLPILREFLDFKLQEEPLDAPVEAVSFEVLESVPGHGAQSDFFNQKEEEAEAWDALVGRLAQKLGKDQVFVATQADRYLPEKAFLRSTTPHPSHSEVRLQAQVPVPDRPTRLLQFPEPIEKDGDLLLSRRKRWRTIQWEGPERLSGEWWQACSTGGSGFFRDYYRVITACGAQLWVFSNRELESPSLFLHGFFD